MKMACVTSGARTSPHAIRSAVSAGLGLLLLAFTAGTVHSQTLLSETTWGGVGSDRAQGVAVGADGSTYLVGVSDSFTTDQFGNFKPSIFLVKFTSTGSLAWQRIWNAPAFFIDRTGVAVSVDGSVYVSGHTSLNGGDAVLLKFDATGALQWQRRWGGPGNDQNVSVAADGDGSVYISGRTDSFGPSSAGIFIVKFDAAGSLVWQKVWDNASGDAVAVAPDGHVYAAGSKLRPGGLAEFDVVVLKMTSTGTLVWQRTYSAGEVVDARGGMQVAADGSIVIAGAIQAPKTGSVDIAALLVALSADGALRFDKEIGGRGGEEGLGVAVAADGAIHLSGTGNSSGSGFEDAFAVRVLATGKKMTSAVAWGSPGFESNGGVAVAPDGTVHLGATVNSGPPYFLVDAALKMSAARGTLGIPEGALADATGVGADPQGVVLNSAGSTTYAGNSEAALIRFVQP
jgi:hypothetical protein